MILTSTGHRAGTISGGCLEAEVAKKAWWLTAEGPSIQRYSSFYDDDGDMPYGLGCGGTVVVLLERGEPAAQVLEALRRSVEERTGSVIVTNTGTELPGTALILNAAGDVVCGWKSAIDLSSIAREALKTGRSWQVGEYFVEIIAPPPAVIVFGAGDDARPLVDFMSTLGWHISIADGRSHLAARERFPRAAHVVSLDQALAHAAPGDAAVIMTHSYEQDRQILHTLLPAEGNYAQLRYIGLLGPRRRTDRLIGEIAPELGLTPQECMARLHTPVGLDLGGHSPASIALAIAAELQAVFAGRQARMLSLTQPIHV
jgi:xanthine/CO dehydrogenase XdhC/CoxF family maturation factor